MRCRCLEVAHMSPDVDILCSRRSTTVSQGTASAVTTSPSPSPSLQALDPRSPVSAHTATNLQNLECDTSPGVATPSSIFAPTNFATNTICSPALFHTIMEEYLSALYPLIPVVHRPSFRIDLAASRERHDRDFFGLLVAICATVIGTMPSKFEQYRSLDPALLRFHTRHDIISHCHSILTSLRGPTYFDEVGYQKWAASYLMSIAFFQVGEHNSARMVEVESMQLGRLLHFHRIENYVGLNCIDVQLRKKGFWLLFYGYMYDAAPSTNTYTTH